MYRILIVEDDPGISAAVAEQMGLWALSAACSRTADRRASTKEEFP